MGNTRLFVLACLAAFLFARVVAAQPSEQELAKQSQNPIANMVSVPFENTLYFDVGPSDKLANVFNLKPVIPVSFERFNLINRFIAPLIWLEGQDRVSRSRGSGDLGAGEVFPGSSSKFGLGNLTYQAFLAPTGASKITWGVGPALIFPTNTDDNLGSDTWSAGIAAVALAMPGKWVVGALVQNTWSYAKHGDAPDQNSFLFQPIVNYNLFDGWYLSSVPVITANWEADGSDKWTVPLGGGFGRVVRFGNRPVDFRLAAFYDVTRPDDASRWNLQLTVKLLFPK